MMTLQTQIAMIAATDDTFETCRRSIEYLVKQTALDRIEMIVVCPSAARLAPDIGLLRRFAAYQIVEVDPPLSTGILIEAGVRAAKSPYVFYVEEHNFPPPETAEKFLEYVAGGDKSAIGFAMRPANPGLVSWAHLFGQFGHVAAPIPNGKANRLGGHHAVYNRDLLMGYGDKLGTLMDNEAVLHEDLRRRGIALHICGEVVVPHVQLSDFRMYLRHEYLAQRIFGAARCSMLRWSPMKRVIYVIGSPLIPFLRTWRVIGHIRRTGRGAELLPQIIPVVFAGTVCGAAGEVLGYVFGARAQDISGRLEIELDRYAFVNSADRAKARAPH